MTKFKVVKSWIEKHSQEYIVEAENKEDLKSLDGGELGKISNTIIDLIDTTDLGTVKELLNKLIYIKNCNKN